MSVEQIVSGIGSVVVYVDPVKGDWVAVARASADGMRAEVRKNGTRLGAVTSAIAGLFAQQVQSDGTIGVPHELALAVASVLVERDSVCEPVVRLPILSLPV